MPDLATLRTELTAASEKVDGYFKETEAKLEAENRNAWTKEELDHHRGLVEAHTAIQQRVERAQAVSVATDIDEADGGESREQLLRQEHTHQRTFDDPNQDPNRPITDYEWSLAFRSWLKKGTQQTEAEAMAVKRCQFQLHSTELEVRWNAPKDETGFYLPAPQSMEEVRSQSQLRMEQRKQEIEDHRQRMRSPEARQQGVAPDNLGGYTVPDSMMLPIDVALLAFGGMRQVADVMRTATGSDMPIPTTNDTANEAVIVAEHGPIVQEDVTFGQIVLNAHKFTSKHVLVSWELLQDSATNIPALMGRLLGERIGRGTNRQFTTGDGTANQCNGILTAATDSGITTASNTAITWQEIMQLKHTVDPDYRPMATWMMHDSVYLQMKQIADTQNRPLWQPSLVSGAPGTFDADPIVINQHMPAAGSAAQALLYGQMSKFIIRDVMPMQFRRLDELFALNGQVAFFTWSRHDSDLVDAGTNPVKYLTLAT